jgi:hypothetical protein
MFSPQSRYEKLTFSANCSGGRHNGSTFTGICPRVGVKKINDSSFRAKRGIPPFFGGHSIQEGFLASLGITAFGRFFQISKIREGRRTPN